jgi:hypothetical protein
VSNFEERLLGELRGVLPVESAPSGGRRRVGGRFALAGGLAMAAAAAATASVVFFATGDHPAYAVTKNADGSVTVEVDSLTNAAGLQAALQAAGVNAVVEYLPEGKTCAQPWFTPAGRIGGMDSSGVQRNADGTIEFTISGDMPAGDTLVVAAQTGPGGEQALETAWATGTVPACQVVDAPAGSGPLGGPPPGGNG